MSTTGPDAELFSQMYQFGGMMLLAVGVMMVVYGICRTILSFYGSYRHQETMLSSVMLIITGGFFTVGGSTLALNPVEDAPEGTDAEPTTQPAPDPAPAPPPEPMDWSQFAPLVWIVGILLALGLAGWIGSAGYRSAKKARARVAASREASAVLAKKWRAASERATDAQMLQAGYEGVPLGEMDPMQAWTLAFQYPEFSNVSRPEHQKMVRALQAMDAMRESLRVPGTATTGSIKMTGTPEQLERFLVAVGEYELAIETNLAQAKRLRDSQLPEELRSLIGQSQRILSQIGEGSVLPKAMVAQLLEKLDRNVARINELHGSHLVAPAVAKQISGQAAQLRELTA